MSNAINSPLVQWEHKIESIKDFWLRSTSIICNPIWQRADTDDEKKFTAHKLSKRQSIIQAVLDGVDIGEIKLCLYKGQLSSVDGGHRKRAIIAFLNNEFKLHPTSEYGGVFFRDLPKDVQEYFMNYDLRFVEFPELTDSQIGKMFRSTNTTTLVNHQEMLNSFGLNPIAVLVRNTVRYFKELKNKPHPLFKSHIKYDKDNNPEKVYEFLSFNNNRLFIEEIVARILCRITHGETFGLATDSMLYEMYVKYGEICTQDPKVLETLEKKLNKALDFLLSVAKSALNYRATGLTQRQFSMLIRVYFHLLGEYKTFDVPDYDIFWEEFANAMQQFEAKNPTRTESFREGEKGTGKIRVVAEAFKGYMAFDLPSVWKMDKSLEWFLEEFNLDTAGIVIRDKKRCFTRDEIETALISQGYKCYVDGKTLTMKDAVGAHKKAWSKGGKTSTKNLVAVRSKYNSESGSQDIDTYKLAMGY